MTGLIALGMVACNTSQSSRNSQATSPATPLTKPVAAVKAPVTSKPAVTAIQSIDYEPYHRQQPLQGYLRSIGSDSMDEVIAEWETELGHFHPTLRFRHEGKGSSTALPALLEQRSDIGPMSRPLKAAEIASFQQKFGYAPTQFTVAIDSLAVYVHPDNPILQSGLSLDQLKNIFSQSETPITRWGQLGLTGNWTNAPIRLHGRNPASGTYAFFKSTALSKQDYSESLKEHPGSAEVVTAVGADPYAIGYSGIAYMTPAVRATSLQSSNGTYIAANQQNAVSGRYPLSRGLYITLNIDPTTGPNALQKEFMRFAYSKEGQQIVSKVGYFPVSVADAKTASIPFK
jgi:phosphate transport system substrate-binding protein